MPAVTDQIASSFVGQLARGAFDGIGPLAPAREVARQARVDHATVEEAVDAVVSDHIRLAAANGFVTGLGGFIVLPVAVPANLLGFYTLAARMTAAIADLRGHDITAEQVRLEVLATLTGDDLGKLLSKAGVVMPAAGATTAWLRRAAPTTTTMINKAIGIKLLVETGERALVRLGRAIPMAGGVIGGGIDAAMIRSIATHARRQFPPVAAPDAGTDAQPDPVT